MLGGTRNGRVVKMALLSGTILVTLYFLISWRMEAQNLTKDLEVAEEEYARLVKKLKRLENELKESVTREARMGDIIRQERQTHAQTNKAKLDLEAKYKTDLESKKNQVTVLEGEKAELREQIQAVKADRDAKSQEAQRLREEQHEAKEAADDEYQALSATCVQNQQTCERRAKQAEDDLSSIRSEAVTNHQSLLDCKNRLTVQQELADSCNTRLASLQKEGTSRLNEIEQIQSQLHLAQQTNEKLVSQMRHEQQNLQVGHSRLEQPNNVGQDSYKLRQGYGNGGNFNNEGGNFHGGDAGVRDRRDDGNIGRMSLREGGDPGINSWREGRGIRNQGDQFHRIENRDDRFHGIGNQGGDLPGIGKQGDQFLNQDNQFHRAAKESFDDFRISDEQKQSVFDSLQGKMARGETLDDRQLKILQLLSKDFSERKHHVGDDKKNAPRRDGMMLENQRELHQEAVADIEDRERLDGDKLKQEEQLPNPLDEGEVKDLVEEQQKPGEFDNLGGDRKLEVVDRDQEEPVGAGGEELKQVVAAKDDQKEENNRGQQNEERDEDYRYDDGGGQEGKKGGEREGDNPLPRPIQNEANPDDEDDYGGPKKDKDKEEEDDVYGDQAYKQDKKAFKNERLQQKYDRQL